MSFTVFEGRAGGDYGLDVSRGAARGVGRLNRPSASSKVNSKRELALATVLAAPLLGDWPVNKRGVGIAIVASVIGKRCVRSVGVQSSMGPVYRRRVRETKRLWQTWDSASSRGNRLSAMFTL